MTSYESTNPIDNQEVGGYNTPYPMRATHPLHVTIALIAILILSGCGSKTTRIPETGTIGRIVEQPANTQPSVTIETPEAMPSFSQDEIAQHTKADDCWVSMQGKTYDVSLLIQTESRANALLNDCGKDASATFGSFDQELKVKFLEQEIGSFES